MWVTSESRSSVPPIALTTWWARATAVSPSMVTLAGVTSGSIVENCAVRSSRTSSRPCSTDDSATFGHSTSGVGVVHAAEQRLPVPVAHPAHLGTAHRASTLRPTAQPIVACHTHRGTSRTARATSTSSTGTTSRAKRCVFVWTKPLLK